MRLTTENFQAYCDYYGLGPEDFRAGCDDKDIPDLPPEMSWEEFCLFNGKEADDDYD